MIFGLGKKKRHVVVTVLVGVDGDGCAPVRERAVLATKKIVAAHGAFDVAAAEVADVARALLDHQADWSHGALGGDIYDKEADASAGVADVYADLAGRYLASDGSDPKAAAHGTRDERRVVVMLTVAYAGEDAALERELNDRNDVIAVLEGIAAQAERDTLLAAQVHAAPAHPEDVLTDEQLLVCFPELQTL
jgi:hypothetical protein